MISTAARSCSTIFSAALATFALGVVAAAPADAAERVLIWGKMTDSEHQPEFADDLQRDRENLCLVEGQIRMAWDQARLGIGNIVAELALPTDIEFEANEAYHRAANAVCEGEEIDLSYFTSSNTFIVYSHCSMFMRSTDAEGNDLGGLSIFLNEGINEALMYFRDPETGKAYKVAINREMKAAMKPVEGEPEIFGPGSTTATSMKRIGGPEVFMLGTANEMSGYEAYHYQYDYESSLSGGLMGDAVAESSLMSGGQTPFESLAAMTKVTTTGSAWIAPDVPGVAIVNTFYNNFARIIEGQQGAMSFLGGMLQNQGAITAHGLPLSYITDTQAAMGMHATSTFDAENIKVIPARVDECTAQPVPAGFQVVDLNEQMETGGADQPGTTGFSPQQQAEMDAAMAQAAAAMQQMTPEQRRMMEQMGLGNMMPGGTMPGATMPGADNQATAMQAVAMSAGSAKAACSSPSSADLQSDDLTQMVQKHLDALGYDVGNTDGEASMETTIAISEFQAEKGMKVTGEVSPQLAGILSAELDKLCK